MITRLWLERMRAFEAYAPVRCEWVAPALLTRASKGLAGDECRIRVLAPKELCL